MKTHDVITALTNCKPELESRFGVSKLYLFGSTARNTATPTSDIDILVDFNGSASSKQYFGVQFYLEDLLKCNVDLVTEKALRPEIRPYVEQDRIHV